jgi:hypothetical protein
VGRDSAVGIATRYGLDGPRIESQWGRDFPNPASYIMCTGYVFRGLRLRLVVDHLPPSSTEVNERVELCLYSQCGYSWPVKRVNFFKKACFYLMPFGNENERTLKSALACRCRK